MNPVTVAIVALISASCVASTSSAQPRIAHGPNAALDAIEAEIARAYVDAGMRPTLVAALERRRRDGRYDGIDPAAFASRVTDDLRDAGHDGHLYLRLDPRQNAALRAKPTGGADDATEDAWTRRRMVREHYGLRDLQVLPGNVRYLRITGFDWAGDATARVYDDAMRFLKDGDAIVIDLRGNGGGDSDAVRYLVSHFVEPGQPLMTFRKASNDGATQETPSISIAELPAGRLVGKPLYVLVDGRSASAAEEFAYHVSQFRLGTLVGARTAGAANNNELRPIGTDFVLSVSVGRPEHPVSHSNWEGVGIEPAIATPSERALDTALDRALDRIATIAGTDGDDVAEARWAQRATQARLNPPNVAPQRLRSYAGRYDRIVVALHGDALWIDRGPRGTARLSPLSDDGWFAIEGDETMRIRADGTSLELWRVRDASPLVLARGPNAAPRNDRGSGTPREAPVRRDRDG